MKQFALSLLLLLAGITCAAAQTYPLEVVSRSSAGKDGLNIVILSEGYTESQLAQFRREATVLADSFFRHTPWKEYKDYINVYRVPIASNVSGAGLKPSEPIDNVYGVCFGTSGVDRMPWPTNMSKVHQVLNATVPDHDMAVILVNMNKYGGGGTPGMLCMSNYLSGYWVNDYYQTFIHEAGHAFAGLADEYWYNGKERPNQTQVSDRTKVKWKNWLGTDGVEIYPYSESPSWYRPHQNCLMRYLGRRYCDVCREALVKSIIQKVSPVLGYEPDNARRILAEPTATSMTFSLDLLKPSPNTLAVTWKLDGKILDDVTGDDYTATFADFDNPYTTHFLSATIEDKSPYLRLDNPSSIHAKTVSWRFCLDGEADAIEVVSAEENGFAVGPVPFGHQLSITRTSGTGAFTASLVDLNGNTVSRGQGEGQLTLSTATLPDGVYVLQLTRQGQVVYTRKLIKTK